MLPLGQRLGALRDEGVLVIGSGFMTHSFDAVRNPTLTGHTAAFDEWAYDAVRRGDVDSLLDYRTRGPGAAVAHPTADHYVPLLLTMGAASHPGTSTLSPIDRLWFGNSIRSLQVA